MTSQKKITGFFNAKQPKLEQNTQTTTSALRTVKDPVGTKVASYFKESEEGWYEGEVKERRIVDSKSGLSYFWVLYNDGDSEEMTLEEVKVAQKNYQNHFVTQSNEKKRKGVIKKEVITKRVKKSTTISEDAPPEVSTVRTSSRLRSMEKHIRTIDENEVDAPFVEDGDAAAIKSEKKRGKRKAAKKSLKKEDTVDFTSSSTNSGEKLKELHEKMHKERKTLILKNNPQIMPKEAFVDPVGIDPTDGIVESIIMTQVKKVAGLLEMAAREDSTHKPKGELNFPIRLQTACSGTDAPSIALSLVQECLQSLEHNFFDYSHVMSCEITPFKQGYIGRNFPGVPLFPDITKLSGRKEVVDIYGRPQKIPEGNLFVAGTSCKDFSMLKSKDRLDIEDKGTSGETFLAAVEFLDEQKPAMAIFENVESAPWEKMQEYITGRIQLFRRNDTTNVISGKKADADSQLKFSISKSGQYVAEEIPRQVGMRAGSIVEGVVESGEDSDNVRRLLSKRRVGSIVTLKELADEQNVNLDKDVLVIEKKVRYCTHLCKLDTKEYGLPQTRNRKYLFIWQSDDPDDDLGVYLDTIMTFLKTPLMYSMDSFLLPDDYDRIRCFREALRSGPGILVKKERAKELDFWDWETSRNLDTPRHMVYREMNGIAEKSRWLTQWSTRGRKRVAPGCWYELFDCWNSRRLDLVDCFCAASARDTIPRDPLHHLFSWDLSQNVTRTQFRTATAGVSSCVTPGGELLITHRGRSLMGFEKLLLQGIPFSRLKLGVETEVQLSDLAGNAMSVSVVCATMLAAICAPQLRREESKRHRSSFINLMAEYRIAKRGLMKRDGANSTNKAKFSRAKVAVSEKLLGGLGNIHSDAKNSHDTDSMFSQHGDLFGIDYRSNGGDDCFFKNLKVLVNDFAMEAFRSSVLCMCESSGATTKARILQCKCCGWSVCHECSEKIQIDSHDLIDLLEESQRQNPHAFERKLRSKAPAALRLSESLETKIKDAEGLSNFSFQLQNVKRKVGSYELNYGAFEDYGAGKQVAELCVLLGRMGVLQKVGASVVLRSFAPIISYQKPFRGSLGASARLIMFQEQTETTWEIPGNRVTTKLKLIGSGITPSYRVQIGLNDTAARSLQAHIAAKKYQPTLKSRNTLLSYHPKWKVWPLKIDVSGDENGLVNGTYERMPCKHTTVFSALWKRCATASLPDLYIYFRPSLLRTGIDTAVIATTPAYRDKSEICELIDWIPENALEPNTHETRVQMINWKPLPSHGTVNALQPALSMEKTTFDFHQEVCRHTSRCCESLLCELRGLSAKLTSNLQIENSIEKATDFELDLFGSRSARNAKKLAIVAAPSLYKYAAINRLPLGFSLWYPFPREWLFVHSDLHVPERPIERWFPVKKGKNTIYERSYDAEESRSYYEKISMRPEAFRVAINEKRGALAIYMNPSVAAHNAVSRLGCESSTKLEVDYCLSELSSMGEPSAKEFKVPNSDKYEETCVEGLELPLYPRQAKALSRMISIEEGKVYFPEEERSEHLLPGIGWCLVARARKQSPLRGGVLGDAIGSGKTVVTIALILNGISRARQLRNKKAGRSGASLVVVPPGLVRQWDDERKKFTGDNLNCIVIESLACLKKSSVSDICEADVVIVPAGIIEEAPKAGSSRPYTEHLSKHAGTRKIPPAPRYHSHREAPTIEGTWVRNMASGPDIYVGNNENQLKRDLQAYYAYCYHEAICNLRKKTFAPDDKGIPLEYFTWERVIIDECHETLVTGKQYKTEDITFKEKARRGAREFLGVAQVDPSKRPLLAAKGVWGLTGTPLLETEARVTELANLMGGTYLTGSCQHWRKEERESGRDLFLNQQQVERSRDYRRAVQKSCHEYVTEACQRNRGEALDVRLIRKQVPINMSLDEGEALLAAVAGLELSAFSFSADCLGEKTSTVMSILARAEGRKQALLESTDSILRAEPETKVIIFANSAWGGYDAALSALSSSDRDFCHVPGDATVNFQNEVISWFRHIDATDEDRSRPRVLLLSFEQAAGHNFQTACHNVILFDPMYSGSDAVADASVEEQAVGRVMRQGQKSDVLLIRIIVKGPNGEDCLDDWITGRNSDEDTLQAVTSNFD